MLEFHPLTGQDLNRLRPFLGRNPYRLCDLTVGGIFIWRDYYNTEWAIHENILYFKVDYPGFGTLFTLPQGGDRKREYEQVREYCRRRGIPLAFYPIPEAEVEPLKTCFPCACSVSADGMRYSSICFISPLSRVCSWFCNVYEKTVL